MYFVFCTLPGACKELPEEPLKEEGLCLEVGVCVKGERELLADMVLFNLYATRC